MESVWDDHSMCLSKEFQLTSKSVKCKFAYGSEEGENQRISNDAQRLVGPSTRHLDRPEHFNRVTFTNIYVR